MFRETALSGQTTFFQKVRSLDYILLICILLLGIISVLSMYSTDGGEILLEEENQHFIIETDGPLLNSRGEKDGGIFKGPSIEDRF